MDAARRGLLFATCNIDVQVSTFARTLVNAHGEQSWECEIEKASQVCMWGFQSSASDASNAADR